MQKLIRHCYDDIRRRVPRRFGYRVMHNLPGMRDTKKFIYKKQWVRGSPFTLEAACIYF
jgi:hypothetical protein